MKKLILSLVMIPLLAVTLIGCGSDDNGNDGESYEPEVSVTDEEADGEDIEEDIEDSEEE